MKNFFIFLAAIALCVSAAATTFNATYTFANYVQNPFSVAQITLTPQQANYNYTNAELAPIPMARVTDTNGAYTFSNLVAGYSYTLDLRAGNQTFRFTNNYPVGLTGTVDSSLYRGFWSGQVFAYYNAVGSGISPTNLTPWPSTINAAGNDLTNLHALKFSDGSSMTTAATGGGGTNGGSPASVLTGLTLANVGGTNFFGVDGNVVQTNGQSLVDSGGNIRMSFSSGAPTIVANQSGNVGMRLTTLGNQILDPAGNVVLAITNKTVYVTTNLVTPSITLNGDTRTAWPSGGGGITNNQPRASLPALNSATVLPLNKPFRVILEGDSIMSGYQTSLPWLIAALLTNNTACARVDMDAVGSSQLVDVINRYTNDAAGMKPAGGTNGIYVCWIGVNNFYITSGGSNLDSVITQYASLINMVHADGFKFCAVVPTESYQRFPDNLTRGAFGKYQTWIRNNTSIDFCADVAIKFPYSINTNWFQDNLHPNQNLAVAAAQIIFNELNTRITNSPTLAEEPPFNTHGVVSEDGLTLLGPLFTSGELVATGTVAAVGGVVAPLQVNAIGDNYSSVLYVPYYSGVTANPNYQNNLFSYLGGGGAGKLRFSLNTGASGVSIDALNLSGNGDAFVTNGNLTVSGAVTANNLTLSAGINTTVMGGDLIQAQYPNSPGYMNAIESGGFGGGASQLAFRVNTGANWVSVRPLVLSGNGDVLMTNGNLTVSGSVTGGAFNGNGYGITNINGESVNINGTNIIFTFGPAGAVTVTHSP